MNLLHRHCLWENNFFKAILSAYGAKDDSLFNQIKEDYVIDVMNWFWTYDKEGKPKSKARIIKKLKRLLNQTN